MNLPASPISINLDQAVYVLSGGLDFVGIDDVQHGKRVAYMALECARLLPWDEAMCGDLYTAALIHDLGVSSTEVHRHLVNEMEWGNAADHCELAAELLGRFQPLAHLATVLLHHHTHWDELQRLSLPPREAQLANLIFLCDRADALRAQRLQAGAEAAAAQVRALLRQHAGSFFDAALVAAFDAASAAPLFWERLAPERLERWFAQERPPDPRRTIGLHDIRDLGRLFAHVVDAKSHFTASHSEGVAQLSCFIALQLGLPREQVELIEVAALLHDLGKLRVPDAILDKRGALEPAEREVMERHAQDSYQLLQRIDGFRQVAMWAGLHHETPCGDGYPELFRREQLPLPARIISVADVFQALAQDRPYRAGLRPEAIVSVLRQEAEHHHLDAEIVALVANHLQQCWEVAVGGSACCTRPEA